MKRIFHIAAAVMLFPAAIGAQSSQEALAQAKNTIEDVQREYAPDARLTVFTIKAFNNNDGELVLAGESSDSTARLEVVQRLARKGIAFADSTVQLPYNVWAQTRIPVASHRTGGRHAAEMATQSLLGTPLRVLKKGADWWQVQSPDGYIAWVPSSSVVEKTPEEMNKWRKSKRFIVTSPYQIRIFRTADNTGLRNVVTDLVNGCIVTADTKNDNRYLHITLPDGREGYADASNFKPIEEWASQSFDPELILDLAYSMEGTPYLWGGMSTKALDCSGLAKTAYFANGIILMRDASQQALTGIRIAPENWKSCKAGDLLFFGNAKTGKVTHVAIYDNNGNYVHSSGRVKRNSIDPDSPDYLTTPFLSAVRIAGSEGTKGITRARNHPWYF